MSSIATAQFPEGHSPFRRLTVDEYHRMIDAGILTSGEPYELIDGFLRLKDRSAAGESPMTVGSEHLWAVKNLTKLNPKLYKLGCHLQAQGPVVMSNRDEPEPDGAILAGSEDDYKQTKPNASDASCVIEVSDSSIRYDRDEKLEVYANSGIAQYIIINLPDRVVEVHTDPQAGKGRYAKTETLRPGTKLRFICPRGRQLEVTVKSLLP